MMALLRLNTHMSLQKVQLANVARNFSCVCAIGMPARDRHKRHQPLRISAQLNTHRLNSTGVEPGAILGFWQSLSNSTPVAYMQDALVGIHDYSGLPWWAAIVLTTMLFRSLVTLPLTIYQHKITARIEKISLEMPAIVEELKREAAMAKKKFHWSDKQTQIVYKRSIKKQWQQLIVRDNCHPMKTLIVLWGQIPLWIFQSVALRNLVHMLPDPTSLQAQIVATEMCIGGFGWIPNLIEVDHSYILPVALGLINLGIIEVQSITRTRPASRLQNIATNVFRGLSLVMVPVACTVPSALCVYWVASSSYGLAQNLLLLSPALRRATGIPKTKGELEDPYGHLWQALQVRAKLIEPPTTTPPTTEEKLLEATPQAQKKSAQKSTYK